MKNLIKYTMGALAAGVMMTACSPEKFDGADPNGIPSVSGVDFSINVDQETNQMIANYTPQPGTYPIWIINGNTYSTLQEVGFQNPEAGTYTIDMKLGNRNGFSQGVISKTFTFNETKIDYSADFKRLCGKEWRIANREVAHMGCGPAGTAGSEWWSAQPNDKKDFGVYDDRITFTADTRKGGTYTYSAGEDGMTYVNTGTTKWGSEAADFDAAIGDQTSTWSFEIYDWEDAEGNVTKQTYIQLGANTLFPYISSDAQYENPKFRIETLTAKKMILVYDAPDRSIAWRFILTSEADVRNVEESGFDANSDFNLWKGVTPTMSFYYNPDPSWSNEQTAVLEGTFKGGNNDYTFTVPNECFADWQAQVHFHTNLNANAATNYDFSVILNTDKDINGVIIKLTDEGDTDAILEKHVDLKAGQDYVVWASDVAGKDMSNLKLATDFGHATGETNISISNIVLKNHADDDGTIVPEQGEEKPQVDWVTVDSPENLGAGFNTAGTMNFWWADGGWSQVADPGFSYADGVYTITAVENGGSEWQGQCSITGVALNIEEGQAYDVRVKVVASEDLNRCTLKVNKDPDITNDPNTLCYKGDFKLEEGENFLEMVGVVAKNGNDLISFDQAKLIIDFGGAPAGFEAKVSNIIIQKHKEE